MNYKGTAIFVEEKNVATKSQSKALSKKCLLRGQKSHQLLQEGDKVRVTEKDRSMN